MMSKSSVFLAAGRPMGSSTSGSSYRSDDDCYVDEYLVKTLERKRNSVMQLMNKAEEKQFTEPDIKDWLVNIKQTMYDANTLLDRIDTEARFREKYKEDGSRDEGLHYTVGGYPRAGALRFARYAQPASLSSYTNHT